MQSVEPSMPQSSYKEKDQVKQVPLCDDKNCQSTKYIYMLLVKSAMKSKHMQAVEPAIPQQRQEVSSKISSDTVNSFVVNIKGC